MFEITLSSIEEASKLNKEICKTPYNIWVHSINNDIMVDGRSLFGLCAIINIPSHLVGESDVSESTLIKIIEKVKK